MRICEIKEKFGFVIKFFRWVVLKCCCFIIFDNVDRNDGIVI